MKLVKISTHNDAGKQLNYIINLERCLSLQTNNFNHAIDFYNSDGSSLTVPMDNFDHMNQTFEDIWEYWNDEDSLNLEIL